MNTERESTSVDEFLGLGAAAPVDAPLHDETLNYFKERYAPLYRYADAVEAGGAIIAFIGGFGGCIIAIGSLDDSPGPLAFVAVLVIATLAVGFYMACQLLAAAVRAFADMAVGTAPGLDDAGRRTIIRGSAATTKGPPPAPPRELTDYFAPSPSRSPAAVVPSAPTEKSVSTAPSAAPSSSPSATSRAASRALAPASSRNTAAVPTVAVDADIALDDDLGEDPTRITPPPAAPPSALHAPAWYLARDGEPTGPWDLTWFQHAAAQRAVTAASLVWRVGDHAGWQRLDADTTLRRALPTAR